MEAVVPFLVVPIAFCSACKLAYFGWREERKIEMFPLFFVALNSVFVWSSQGAQFLFVPIVAAPAPTYRNFAIDVMLSGAVYLEPINVFVYTWRLLDILEV